MKLIIGLGNPGLRYSDSKHNIGFKVVRGLAKAYKISLKKEKGTFSISGRGRIDNQAVVLALPVTFMNLSGVAVKSLVKRYKIDFNNLLVVCDDLDLGFKRIKIKAKGSSGGHKGLKSIIESLGTEGFARLRIGIGRPHRQLDTSEYVLCPFSKKEQRDLTWILQEAGECCKSWLTKGITYSMNIFNLRSKHNE